MSTAPTITMTEAEFAREAAHRVVETHRRLVEFIREGRTLVEVDTEAARILKELDCRSCFLRYRVPRVPPYPNHACLSVNECIVHGTSESHREPLKRGGPVLRRYRCQAQGMDRRRGVDLRHR